MCHVQLRPAGKKNGDAQRRAPATEKLIKADNSPNRRDRGKKRRTTPIL